MKEYIGNLLKDASEGKFDIIVHGCNIHHNMGGGIAAVIAKLHPDALRADKESVYADESKLGNYTVGNSSCGKFKIVNLYTQRKGGIESTDVLYNHIPLGLKKVSADFPLARIGIPLIGGGIAGGNPDTIKDIMHASLNDYVSLVVFEEN